MVAVKFGIHQGSLVATQETALGIIVICMSVKNGY